MVRATPIVLAAALLLACDRSPPEPPAAKAPSEATGLATRSLERYGQDLDHAVEIAPGIWQARGTGNAHAISTAEGRVIFDCGLPTQVDRLRGLLDAADASPIRYVIASHAHLDHVGGAETFLDPGAELIAQRAFLDTQRYLHELAPLLLRRNKVFYPDAVPPLPDALLGAAMKAMYPTFEPTIIVDARFDFELGGKRFEVLHTPGAEGADSLSLWLPAEKILFTGDFFGPIFPMFPNLTTIRGEKFREPVPYLRSLELVLELDPELIVPSHFEPIEGRETIRAGVTRMRDALAYVHDAVIEGMNDGKDVYTLMAEIELPEHLYVSQAHGRVPWVVRGTFESYATWFHFEDTSQLYPAAPDAIHPELVALAGGANPVAARAREHLEAGEPVAALQLLEAALDAEPENEAALRAMRDTLHVLLEQTGDVNHHEVFWLRREITAVEDVLD
ncbi:MAG: MBL fold metallo-hydrolase [Myxococcota bacterium]